MSSEKELEKKHERAVRILQAAYERARVAEPKMNGRSFVAFIREADKAEEGEEEEEMSARLRHWALFLAFLFAKGPSPDRVTKRLYAMTWALNKELLLGMNIRQVSELLGEVRATGSLRINNEFTDYLALWGFKGVRVNGQKSQGSRDIFSQLAKGNTNRRHGRKKGDRPER